MKKVLLVIVTMLVLIDAFFPKTYMGRVYINDLDIISHDDSSLDTRFKLLTEDKYLPYWEDQVFRYELVNTDPGVICVIHIAIEDADCAVYPDGNIYFEENDRTYTINAFDHSSVDVDAMSADESERIDGIMSKARTKLHKKIGAVTVELNDMYQERAKKIAVSVCVCWVIVIGIAKALRVVRNKDGEMDREKE